MPLGLMPGMGYEENETILEAGEAALFYSDGLVEAHDPKGEMFGFPVCGRLSPSTARSDLWGNFSYRSFTPALERSGSRRTISPSLRSVGQSRAAELPEISHS